MKFVPRLVTTAIKVFAHFAPVRIELEIVERFVLTSLRRPFLCVLVVVGIAKKYASIFASTNTYRPSFDERRQIGQIAVNNRLVCGRHFEAAENRATKEIWQLHAMGRVLKRQQLGKIAERMIAIISENRVIKFAAVQRSGHAQLNGSMVKHNVAIHLQTNRQPIAKPAVACSHRLNVSCAPDCCGL